MIDIDPIPFQVPNVDSLGIKRAEGLLKIEDECLILELKKIDNLLGIYSSEIEQHEIPLKQVNSLKCSKKLFGAKIAIQTSSMKVVQEVPGMKQGNLVLKISKKDFKNADKLQSVVNIYLSEYKISKMDEEGIS